MESGNSCGIYAMKSRDDLDPNRESDVVIGTVALWGRVIEHAKGYRAKFAYPIMLDLRERRIAPPMPGFPVVLRSKKTQRQYLSERVRANYGCLVLI